MKQRYICCAYISTNSKIYNILQASCVPCVKVHVRSCGGSIWLFVPWGLGFLCKV